MRGVGDGRLSRDAVHGKTKRRESPRRWTTDQVMEGPEVTSRESFIAACLIVVTFVLRALYCEQPIVENYVGRQVPTAMVARNLARGSGFLHPQLDTGPFPNDFLVEPPIYASLAATASRVTGLGLEPSGRLVSALAMALGGWGLFGLARRREGTRVALLALAVFAILPVTLRYGRAFQPDALMLGLLLAGLRAWDEFEAGGRMAWLGLASLLLATGLALKIVSAYILVPLLAVIARPPRRWKVGLGLALLVPALCWYAYAGAVIAAGSGSRASADNGAIWLRVLVPSALLRIETATVAARFVLRSFTPIGLVLAAAGLAARGDGARLWRLWGVSALGMLAVLAGKLHHEYYWLAAAPVVAVGVGKGLALLDARSRCAATAAACVLLGFCLAQSRSTWRTPAEWASLAEASAVIESRVPPGAWVAAPEALLFASDRRGCRLEFTPASARRAAGEWGASLPEADPLALVEFYRSRGARFVADVGAAGPERLALHEAIRRRYNVLVDRPGVLLAALDRPQGSAGWPPPNPPSLLLTSPAGSARGGRSAR